jgi:RNA polymerase sigma-70 factor (ECF subfamily)
MAESQTDATLLERFVSHREEAAFAALVCRHGPRVERICRRILRNEHDVEEVFQATFLVLSRKAAGIPWRDSVSPWLDGVARRLAMNARSGMARQRHRETPVTVLAGGLSYSDGRLPERYHPLVEPSVEVDRRDLRRVLDDELQRLPEKYRAPVVLCDLEGHTSQEAARRLGWPAGSMSRRLRRARALLRRRLTHRGLTLAMIGLASAAIAAAAIGLGPGRSSHDATVRQAMAPFKPAAEGGCGYGDVLAAAARVESSEPDFARILSAAREAARAARRLEDHDRGPLRTLWSQYVRDMKRAAMDLELACRETDSLALVATARRLDASCLNCHAIFRQGSTEGVTHGDLLTFRPAPPDPADRHRSLHRASTVRERERLRHLDVRSLTLARPAALTACPPSRPDAPSRSLTLTAPIALSIRSRFRPGPRARSLTLTALPESRHVASNEWAGVAVRVGWAPPTDHHPRSVGGAHPT